ncbi:MAG: BREX-1 system adenine-specific DNA-methyltransferase PglX, partial [Desulfobacteraceae bacterium]|nr:BREX-1 system adenine-specific DNA-methyltransferase PglX [Desulfobacteraceae bacterium]
RIVAEARTLENGAFPPLKTKRREAVQNVPVQRSGRERNSAFAVKPETETALRRFVVEARRLLLAEVEDQLEKDWGLPPDGRFVPVENRPGPVAGPEGAAMLRSLEARLDGLTRSGLPLRQARGKLARGEVFSRLAGLVIRRMEAMRAPGGQPPVTAGGDGARPLLPGPGPAVLSLIMEGMNAPQVAEAFAPGNEEALGWLYQYFNEREKREVFETLNRGKRKIPPEDIPLATQLFTPGWIVAWIVENSLGRHWLQMHPDSRLADRLRRLVPSVAPLPALPLKKACEITFLDPACGTMHFGLAAYDLFLEMYREEFQRAGEPGWPGEPSVAGVGDIPAAILRHNIFGLDIDPLAAGLARTALGLRAMREGGAKPLPVPRVYCAGAVRAGGEWESCLEALRQARPACAQALEQFRGALAALDPGGSLARVEAAVRERTGGFARACANASDGTAQRFGKVPGCADCPFDPLPGSILFRDDTGEDRLIERLFCLSELAGAGSTGSRAAAEIARGLLVLGVLRRRFDVVATNPPYLARRSMQPGLAGFLRKEYPDGKGDLYAAFIERCTELLAPGGRTGLIVQQSFMFISSYERLRKRLLGGHFVETMCHAGPHAFEAISGEKVNTTVFVLSELSGAPAGDAREGVYFRLVHEPDPESKRRRFEAALERLRARQDDLAVYRCRSRDFDDIPGSPWVYWIPHNLRRPFKELPGFGELAPPRHGLSTCDNFRYLRRWWEVGKDAIRFECGGTDETLEDGYRWYPYMKGGNFRRWFGNREHVVNWHRDGVEIKADIVQRFPYIGGKWGLLVTNPEFYFRRGITWSFLTSGRFSARLSPGGFLFDVAGSSAFPADIPLGLALLNSSFARYALRLINPTVNFQVGDLLRLPVPATASGPFLRGLVDRAVRLARIDSFEEETDWDFVAPPRWPEGVADTARRAARLARIERLIDDEVYALYGIGSRDREVIEAELSRGPQDRPPAGGEDSVCSRRDLAERWISYAAGIALGRFEPGRPDSPGRGRFRTDIVRRIGEQVRPDGVLVMDEGHPDDMAACVCRILAIA